MPFSIALQESLRKASFPMLNSTGFKLWDELVTALEKNAPTAVGEAKALAMGYLIDFNGVWWDKTLTVKGVSITIGLDDIACFVGSAHAALTVNFDNAVSPKTPIPSLIERVRAIALKVNAIKQSSVVLQPVDGDHKMGTGLTTTTALTYVPDSSLGSHKYGSKPDGKAVATVAPPWAKLSKRVYEKKGADPRVLMKKSHYVLAHLINHNINGSGKDAKNVVPFYAAANTEMSNQVEKYLTLLVQKGIPVQYTISTGTAVGMTPGRQAARDACTTDLEREIIDIEQHLPAYLTLTLAAQEKDGSWKTIVNNVQIDNYVPETVPVT
jgi:hypothetical protein